ncbi:MAG: lipoyl synthase [Candidatus Omnitrophica bacterium]|nr:lipoyl synthase [Candidatus Omnitrophota bacterium]
MTGHRMKPSWLNKKIDLRACSRTKEILRSLRVETVCEQAMCPNIGECFGRGEATFLILGKHCTRACSFCNVRKEKPIGPDPGEPGRVAEAVKLFSLKHAVITSVTRDDLPDGGASLFADTVLSIRERSPGVKVEVLIPDFRLSPGAITLVVKSSPDIIAHNVETVPSLYEITRRGADYDRSLEVLRIVKSLSPKIRTKSGIMLGMGEREDEVYSVMRDLRSVFCDFLSIGQYLAPSRSHHPVKEYITPDKFKRYKEEGIEMGFAHIESGPYVRSSYMAASYLHGK